MRALLTELAFVHDEDGVGLLHGAESVRDKDAGAARDHSLKRKADSEFGVGIDRAGRFVEDKDAGAMRKGSGEADELLLTGGEGASALEDGFGKGAGEGVDEVGNVDFGGGVFYFLIRDPVRAEANVLSDGSGEEERILQDHSETATEMEQILVANVDSVNENLARLDIVEAHHEGGDGGLAGSGVSYDGGGFVGGDGEGNSAEDPFDVGEGRGEFWSGAQSISFASLRMAILMQSLEGCGLLRGEGLVGEPDVAELDAAGAVRENGVYGGYDFGGSIEELEEALGGGHGGLQDVVFVGEVLDGAEEALRVLDEGDQNSQGDDGVREGVCCGECGDRRGVVENTDTATPDDESDGDGAQELYDRVVESIGEDGVGPGEFVLEVDGGEVVEGTLFAVEELNDGHAGNVLLSKGVDLCRGGALAAVAVADMIAKELGRVQDRRNDRKGEQGQRPAHEKHDADDPGEDEDVFEDGEDARGEHLVECVDVGGDTGDEAADGVAVEEGYMERLDVTEDLAAEIEHDLLSSPLHHVGLQELEQEGEGESAEIERTDLRDALDGVAAEMAGEPGKLAGSGREEGVDGYFHEERARNVGGRLDKDADG